MSREGAETLGWKEWRGDRKRRIDGRNPHPDTKRAWGMSACSMFTGAHFTLLPQQHCEAHDDGSATLIPVP